MMKSDLPKLLFTKEETAQILNSDIHTVDHARRVGRLPGRKVGKKIMHTLDDINVFLENVRTPNN